MSAKSLLIDATSVTPRITGIERYTREITGRLATKASAQGWEVTILLARQSPWHELAPGVRTRRSPWSSRLLTEQLWIPAMVALTRPSTSFFPGFPPSPLVFFLNPSGRVIRTIHDAVLWTQTDTLSWKARLYIKAVEEFGTRRYHCVQTVSEFSKHEIETAVPNLRGRLHVCGNAVDLEKFTPRETEPSVDQLLLQRNEVQLPSDYFLFVGTLEPRKNLPFLLRAFSRIAPRIPDAKLVLVGRFGWGGQEVIDTIEKLNLGASVQLLGAVSDEVLPIIYNRARAMLFPSLHEGFGFPVVEAMGIGLPVISSTGGALPETVGNAALLVNPDDEPGWGTAMLEVYNSVGLRGDLRQRGFDQARKFSWDTVAQRVMDSLEATLCPTA